MQKTNEKRDDEEVDGSCNSKKEVNWMDLVEYGNDQTTIINKCGFDYLH